MPAPNPMVPASAWGEGTQPNQLGLLCWTCIDRDGNYTPPSRIVIVGGFSLCLTHAVAPTALPE